MSPEWFLWTCSRSSDMTSSWLSQTRPSGPYVASVKSQDCVKISLPAHLGSQASYKIKKNTRASWWFEKKQKEDATRWPKLSHPWYRFQMMSTKRNIPEDFCKIGSAMSKTRQQSFSFCQAWMIIWLKVIDYIQCSASIRTWHPWTID